MSGQAVIDGFGTTPDNKSTTNPERKVNALISLLQINPKEIASAREILKEITAEKDRRDAKDSSDETKFSIAPAEDKEYIEAVNSGDTKKVRQMVVEAAKKAMPNTKVVDRWGNPRVFYHGTSSKVPFNIFDAPNGLIYFHLTESAANA